MRPPARAGVLAAVVVLTSLVALSASSLGQGADHAVTVVGTEGPDCPLPEQRVYCLLPQGGLDGIAEGETVTITLDNQGQAPHNVYVTTQSQASSETPRDTPAEAAFANSTTADAGGTTEVTFQVPLDAGTLYLWCEVGDHEALGMWLSIDVAAAPAEGPSNEDNATDNGSMEDQRDDGREAGVPGPAAPLAWTALAAATALGRRRR